MINPYETLRTLIYNQANRLTALKGRLNYPNMKGFTQPDSGLWARISINTGGVFIASLGGNKPCTRAAGIITIQCFARRDTADIEITKLVDELCELFAYYRTGKLECLEAYPRVVGESGDWYQVNVNVNFRYDY